MRLPGPVHSCGSLSAFVTEWRWIFAIDHIFQPFCSPGKCCYCQNDRILLYRSEPLSLQFHQFNKFWDEELSFFPWLCPGSSTAKPCWSQELLSVMAVENTVITVSCWCLLLGMVWVFSGWNAAHRYASHGTKLPNKQWKSNKYCRYMYRKLARWPKLGVYSICL